MTHDQRSPFPQILACVGLALTGGYRHSPAQENGGALCKALEDGRGWGDSGRMTELISTWSSVAHEEDSMTDEHAWIWREMIAAVPAVDLSDKSVLDIGCNAGGFLRMLHDTKPIGQGVGVDIARDRVALAEAAKGDRPLRYIASTDLAEAGGPFDLAFSHEMIYLIEDLEAHGRQVAEVLRPGGHYDAVTCCHTKNPLYADWQPRIAAYSNLPVPKHSIGDIASAFRAAGLEVSISRFLATAFVPMGEPHPFLPTDLDNLDVYTRWKLCFRCRKPG